MAHSQVHETLPTLSNDCEGEGHLPRVIEMFDEGRSCLDLAKQLHAVEKAVGEANVLCCLGLVVE
jgi:hypothetical protein